VDAAVIVLTTWPAKNDPAAMARTLVGERLAACVNVLPEMQSTYRWKDDIEVAGERQIVIKTTETRVTELEARLQALHPYEVPEFLVVAVTSGSDSYLTWLRNAVRP
jgi:periplasmic divalent cation tolerance protein